MVGAVNRIQVADVETVDLREVHLGVFDIEVPLKFAGVFHGHDGFLLSEVILAEYVKPVFAEFSVKSGCYFSYLVFDYTAKREGEGPVFIFEMSYIASVLETVSVSTVDDLPDFFPVGVISSR